MIKTIEYNNGIVRLIDQTRLPGEEVYVECRDYQSVGDAIKYMLIRGAPAIGVAAAMGVAIGANNIKADGFDEFYSKIESICDYMIERRPTAVNLSWAVKRMKNSVKENREKDVSSLKKTLEDEAIKIWQEDLSINKIMAENGEELIKDGNTILTHCNAGALATAGDYGTALGVIKAAFVKGKNIRVFADETRPFLQGARLTAWEMKKEGIPVRLITDNMAGYFMKKGEIDLVIVGADRIAANGDVANKIGTYTVAVLAREHNIPFYVVAPISTLDMSLDSGDKIPIEERDKREVTDINGRKIAPDGIDVLNPVFDVTPNRFVNAIINEKGIIRPPYHENLKKILS
ncbi:MAG: S-methyl-5-thioribose-1-phosphate isomerase [Nitrospinota bacterium]